MDKGGILGEVLEQAGSVVKQTAKQMVKTPLEVGKGAAEQVGVKPQPQESREADLNRLKTKEEEERAKNLVLTRQNLAELMVSKRTSEPRPAERVERQEQQKQQELERKEAQKPPPLPIQKRKGTKERLPGISG